MTTKTTTKKKRQPKKGDSFFRRNQLALIIAGSIIGMLLGAASALVFGRTPQTVRLTFTGRETTEAVGDTLRSRLGSRQGARVYVIWRALGGSGGELRGSYLAEKGMTAARFGYRMARGHESPVRLTFNNVRTLDELARRVTANLAVSPEAFLAATDSLLSAKGFKKAEYPAAFLCDTYEVYATTSAEKLVRRLVKARDTFWNPDRIAKARELGLDPVGVTTIASIVAEETSKADERPKMARLYLNRLARGMKLQADPTVKFAIGDFSLRRIGGSMLNIDSPYNTYRVKGLPPGPIRIVDPQLIDDVLNAPAHNYIYMCAREDFSGYHNFSTDYATHQANAKRYQAELDRRKIH